MQNDERLVAFIRHGNSDAFDVLFNRYQARLLAFCRHMVGSQEDAEDVLQEVFTAAYNAMRADGRKLNVRPWLYRIARNRCLNHLRKPKPTGQESMDGHAYSSGISTAQKVEQRAEFRHLISDVGDLPETQRTALLLREIDNLSYEDISVTMDTTVPSVKSLLVRARISLAEAAQARELTCDEVRVELGKVAEGLQKTSAPVRRHVRQCEQCRRFKAALQRTNRTMAAIYPIGPLVFIKKFVIAKLLLGGGGSAAGGAAAGSATAGGAAAGGVTAGGAAAGGVAAGGAASGGGLVTAGIGAVAVKAAASVAAAAVVATAAVNVQHEPVKEKTTQIAQSQVTASRDSTSESSSSASSVTGGSGSATKAKTSAASEPKVASASETKTEPAETPVVETEPTETTTPAPNAGTTTPEQEPVTTQPSEPTTTTPAPATPAPVETPVSEKEGSVSLPDTAKPGKSDGTEPTSDREDVTEPPGEPADGEAVPAPVAGEPDLDVKPKAHARRTHTKRFRKRR